MVKRNVNEVYIIYMYFFVISMDQICTKLKKVVIEVKSKIDFKPLM